MLKHYGANSYPVDTVFHLTQTDNEVMSAIRLARADASHKAHLDAEAILGRGHFRQVYSFNPSDQQLLSAALEAERVKPDLDKPFNSPAYQLAKALGAAFGGDHIKIDLYIQHSSESIFPVLMPDGRVEPSVSLSPILDSFPLMTVDSLYAAPTIAADVRSWITKNRDSMLSGASL
jgi:hypothetical protein